MPTTDSNGIIRYLDTDGAPTPPVLNLGMQSVSDALSPYINRVKWTGAGTGLSANLFTNDVNNDGARLRLGVDGSVRVGRVGDDTLRFLPFAFESNTVNVSFSIRSNYSMTVNFPANSFTTVPQVTTNIASGSGDTLGWISRATQVSATGFTLYLYSTSGTPRAWSSIPVMWIAAQSRP